MTRNRLAPAFIRAAVAAIAADLRGMVAVEFALVFPVMVLMLLGLYDGSMGLIAYRRVTVAAETAAVMGTELSLQLVNSATCISAPCTSLTPTQAQQAMSAIYGVMPTLYGEAGATFSVTMSAVSFTAATTAGSAKGVSCVAQTGANCTYTPQVAWSVASTYGAALTRPCGPLVQVAQTATPSIGTVPTLGMSPLTSILIVDVSYTYKPLFSYVFTGPVKFSHSAFLPPRINISSPTFTNATTNPVGTSASSFIEYDVLNPATDTAICPGYRCTTGNICS